MCDRFRHETPVPASYLASLPTQTSASLLRRHLDAGVKDGDAIALYSRGAEVIGVGRPDLVRLSATDVTEAVLDGLGGRPDELEFTRLSFGQNSVRFDVDTKSRRVRGEARGRRVRGRQRVAFAHRRVRDAGGGAPLSAGVQERGGFPGMRAAARGATHATAERRALQRQTPSARTGPSRRRRRLREAEPAIERPAPIDGGAGRPRAPGTHLASPIPATASIARKPHYSSCGRFRPQPASDSSKPSGNRGAGFNRNRGTPGKRSPDPWNHPRRPAPGRQAAGITRRPDFL